MNGLLAGRAQFVQCTASLVQGHKGSWRWLTGWLQDKYRVCIEEAAGPRDQGDGCSKPSFQHQPLDTSLTQMMMVPPSSSGHRTLARKQRLVANIATAPAATLASSAPPIWCCHCLWICTAKP